MSENKDSQRWTITELLELIANQIASYSHHSEIYNSLQSDLLHQEVLSDEEVDKKMNDSAWHYQKMMELLENRRETMRELKSMAKEYDSHLWCICKHAIASYQFSQEVLNTDMENEVYMSLAEKSYQYMYECVSRLLWVEPVTCARCLQDELENER